MKRALSTGMMAAGMLASAILLAGCDRPLTTGEKGAIGGAAIGTGIGLATGGSFGQVVGGGLIGGGIGYLGGTAIDASRK
jgi:hypothetical protein